MFIQPKLLPVTLCLCMAIGCSQPSGNASTNAKDSTNSALHDGSVDKLPFAIRPVTSFEEPWAMAFLPDGRLLVTEKKGRIKLFDPKTRTSTAISGIPAVAYGGQGGLGDIVLHPQFGKNQLIYFSYAEAGQDGKGAVVARAHLILDAQGGGQLSGLQTVWRQTPKVSGNGHYGHRIAFDKQGMLWISSGERQKFDPAQDMNSNLGKIIRLHDDGSIPADNPFASKGGTTAQIWSLGHRNPLGIAFDGAGQLWEIEMGPKGGDELNLIERGKNYGYPIVSNGDHYSGIPIPDHHTRPEFAAPVISWTPVISPSSLMFYSSDYFSHWKGNAFAGGLSSEALIRISFKDNTAQEAERFPMGERIRAVAQGPDGTLWLLQDGKNAQLLQLTKP
jgi:glucose/arabinose dehydrogenase